MLLAIPSSLLFGVMGPYDEPKALALVALVGITGLAWLIARSAGAAALLPPSDGPLRFARWIIVAYGAWWAVATVLSVAPGQSLWGGFGRGFGLSTFLAALALFGIVQAEIRGLDRATWLIDLALIGSIPVVAVALGQALGWDPLPGSWDPATALLRVRSTFGQHIFLGSYLVVLIPLAVGRIMTARGQADRVQGFRIVVASAWAGGMIALLAGAAHGALAWSGGLAWSAAAAIAWTLRVPAARVGAPPSARFVVLGLLVAAQLVTLVLSTARGALVGLLVGLAAAAMVLLVGQGARRTLLTLGTGVLVIVLFVGVLNIRGTPLDDLKRIPLFRRLGSIAEIRQGTPGWVRLRLWEGIISRWPRQLVGEQVLPGLSPPLRALVGFGPEAQIFVLDRFLPASLSAITSRRRDVSALYTFDRAHNEVLDHLVTTGVVGALVWLGVVGGVVAAGVIRLRSARGTIEVGIRLGCLAAVLGQVVEGLFGIPSPMPRALFWMAAAMLTAPFPFPPSSETVRSGARQPATGRRRPRLAAPALVAGAFVLVLTAIVGGTRSLLASMAYGEGIRKGLTQDLRAARQDFLRATDLAPWVPFPAEAAADVSTRLAAAESGLGSRMDWLAEAQAALVRARQHVAQRGDLWRLSAQIEMARVRDGHPERFEQAIRDFEEAARLNPNDPDTLAAWAMALSQSGDVEGARQLALRALASDGKLWLGWAVMARVEAKLGNMAESRRSAEEARRVVPPVSRQLLEMLLP